MCANLRILLAAVVFCVGGASARSQEFTSDLMMRTPDDALLCVEVADMPRLLESLAETAVGKAINRTPLARIGQKILSERNWSDGDVAIGEADTEQFNLLAEVAQVFYGPSSLAVMPEGESVGYCLRIGLSQRSSVVGRFEQVLRDDHRSMGLLPDEGDHGLDLYRHDSGFSLGFDGEALVIGDSRERVMAWFDGPPLGAGEVGLAASRKWLRVKENLGVRDADVFGYCDTKRLIDIYLEGHPQGLSLRRLMAATAVSDALAMGWSLRVGGQEAECQLDAFLLCAVPRKGVWGALSLATIDRMVVPHCPIGVGYALIVRSDLPALVRSLSETEQLLVAEELMTSDEFRSLVVRTAPPLILALILRDRAEEIFSGECFVFGSTQPSRRSWFNNFSLGVGIVEGMEPDAWAMIAGMFPPGQAFEPKTTDGHEWWIQNAQAHQALVDQVREREEELGIDDRGGIFVPRLALACSDQRLILFSSFESVESSLAVTHDIASGIEFDEEFGSVVEHLRRTGNGENPSLLFFCRAEECIKWPLYKWIGPGSDSRFEVWKQIHDQQPTTVERSFLGNAQQTWWENRDQWPSSADLTEEVGPVGAAVWDTPAGLRGSLFLLRVESHGSN